MFVQDVVGAQKPRGENPRGAFVSFGLRDRIADGDSVGHFGVIPGMISQGPPEVSGKYRGCSSWAAHRILSLG